MRCLFFSVLFFFWLINIVVLWREGSLSRESIEESVLYKDIIFRLSVESSYEV